MLNIQIKGIKNDKELELTNHGHSIGKKKEKVQWEVLGNSGVSHIEDIVYKSMSGSTNVFSSNPPTALNGTKKIWRAEANDVQSEQVYVYTIRWVKKDSTEVIDFDPIISIKPSDKFVDIYYELAKIVCTAVITFFTLNFIRKKENKKLLSVLCIKDRGDITH